MKMIKFIISSILIFLVLMIFGEIPYFDALNSLSNKAPKAEFAERAINDNNSIAYSAEEIYQRLNCDIFFIKYDYLSLTETNVTIICRENIINDLKKEFSLSASQYKSLFGGTLTVLFEKIPDVKEIKGYDYIYFYGEQADIINTYNMLKNELGGGVFYEYSYDNRYIIFSHIVSMAALAIISFSSLCECEFKKKFYAIKIVFGTKSTELFFRELTSNLLWYFFIIVFECLLIFKYNELLSNLKQIIFFYFLLEVCISMIYVNIFNFDVIKILKGKRAFTGIINLGYAFKFIMVILTVFSGAMFCKSIPEISESIMAKRFFSEASDWSFCDFQTNLDLNDLNSSRKYYGYVNESIYRTYYTDMSPILLSQINIHNEFSDNIEMVYANSNAREYLQSVFGVQNTTSSSEIIIFLPQNLRSTNVERTILNAYETTEGDHKYTYSIVYIKKDYKLLSINSDINKYYKYLKNPVVIFNTVPANEMDTSISDSNKFNLYRNIIYANTDNYINTIQKEYDLSMIIKTPCNDYFTRLSRQNELVFYFLFFSFILFLAFVLFMSSLVAKSVFKVNAKIYAIKKLLGYCRREIYSGFILTAILSDAAPVLLCLFAGFNMIFPLVITGAFLIIMDAVFVLFKIFALEKASISKIIKDGLYD